MINIRELTWSRRIEVMFGVIISCSNIKTENYLVKILGNILEFSFIFMVKILKLFDIVVLEKDVYDLF